MWLMLKVSLQRGVHGNVARKVNRAEEGLKVKLSGRLSSKLTCFVL